MTDLEQRLRDLLDEQARGTPAAHDTAPTVRRTRRRQVVTVLSATIGTVVAVAVAVVGVSAVLDRDRGVPAARPTTTSTLNGITITYPDSWYLIDPDEAGLNGGSEGAQDLPRLVLALSPQPPSDQLACPGLVEGSAPTFLMTVQERPLSLTGAPTAPWPATLEVMNVAGETACYPEWTFEQASWTAEGRTFEAVVGTAPGISDADRSALVAAFDSMTFERSPETPTSVVLATGTAGGEDWELIGSSDAEGLSLSLQTQSSGTGTGGFGDDPAITVASHVFGEGQQAERVVFGAVPADAVRLVATDAASAQAEIPILDVPDGIDPRLNAFVATIDPELVTSFEAFDEAGDVVAHGSVGSEPGEPSGPPLAELEDGRHFGYIEAVDVDERTIGFDLAIWLTGEEANQAYQEATGQTGPVPNDYFVVNDNPRLRTLTLAPDLRLRLLDWNRCCDRFFEGELEFFAEAIAMKNDVLDGDLLYRGQSQWWIIVEDGVVTEIEEQYTP